MMEENLPLTSELIGEALKELGLNHARSGKWQYIAFVWAKRTVRSWPLIITLKNPFLILHARPGWAYRAPREELLKAVNKWNDEREMPKAVLSPEGVVEFKWAIEAPSGISRDELIELLMWFNLKSEELVGVLEERYPIVKVPAPPRGP